MEKTGLRRWVAASILAISLTVMVVDLAILLSNRHEDNRTTFYALTHPWSDYSQLRQEWRPRILSNVLASQVARWADGVGQTDESRMSIAAAAWTGIWYLAISAVIVGFTGRHAVFYLFVYFAGVTFGYLPTVNARIYPWDLPSLFVFTLFMMGIRKNSSSWAWLVLPAIGVLFKESAVVLCVAFLFVGGTWKDRLTRCAIAGGLCFLVKLGVDILVGIPLPGNSMTTGDAEISNLSFNLHALTHVSRRFLVHPFMVNAGTLVVLFMLTRRDPRIVMSQTLALIFLVMLLVFGRIVEYRIWFELIPIAALPLEIAFLGDRETDAAAMPIAPVPAPV